ncbi:hypothetical protein ACIBF7_01285 [Nonomuraea sp. NPDC050478]|uniref:hypothetical protein n=1 Tax=Nonomuraea sp. NPDC050478 TaxID=3364365 RepID=UPI00378FE681
MFAAATDTALVALITGGSAVLAAFTGAGWSVVTERAKAKHARRAAEEQRDAERRDARARETWDAYYKTQAAVLGLGLSVGISLDMRASSNARLDGEDLPTQLRLVRAEYLAATVAIERLWPLCPPSSHDNLRMLSNEVSTAFGYARGVSQQQVTATEVEKALQERLRALGDDLSRDEHLRE